MYTHLEKIAPSQNQFRFYSVSVVLNLFGEWAVVREWGRIGSRGGQRRIEWHASYKSAVEVLAGIKQGKERRGYVARPVQLDFPF